MAKTTKVVEYDGKSYTLATITTGVYKKQAMSGNTTMGEIVVASLLAGGHEDAQAIDDDLPIFNSNVVQEWVAAAQEVNGLKAPAGEAIAEPVPAE